MEAMQTLCRLVLPGIMLIAFASGFYKAYTAKLPASFQLPAASLAVQATPRFESHFASAKLFTQVHAASAIELKDGRIRAFWFSGSHEGARDVAIHSAVFDPLKAQWGREEVTATREQTQRGLHRFVSMLGNPVIGRAADGTLRLFYVTVSVGGWGGSAITTMTSRDEGETWGTPRRLVTSPFLNVSTLVKGVPFLYRDGAMGLPVYHEFISTFAELLRLDNAGDVLDKQRLVAGGQGSLQPVVLVQNEHAARVLMRYSGAGAHRVLTVSTQDAGQHWTTPRSLAIPNPDAAVTGVALSDGRLLAVLNNIEQGRDELSLMISSDGGNTWREVQRLEDQLASSTQADEAHFIRNIQTLATQSDAKARGHIEEYVESIRRTACNGHGCRYEYSYPYLIHTQGGDFHLVYTWNRTFIKHVWFNQAWLDQRLKDAAP